MANQPLHGLTIVVTRPRDQAAQLAQSIEQAGGIPLLFPLLDITAVQDSSTLNGQIARLGQFNLAIFISPNAVHYGIAALRAAGASLSSPSTSPGQAEPSDRTTSHSTKSRKDGDLVAGYPASVRGELKIATVGQGSAKALRESGITNVISPTERFDSEGLLALPELQNVAGWRVMIFRGDGGRELLGDTLKARGATVEYATCYQRSKPHQDAGVLLAAVPDAITVTSSEALGYLWQMLNACPEPSRRDRDRAALRNTPLFVPHARIAGLAREQGWLQVQVTASGDDGMLSALITWAGQRKKGR
jgi:uroporphyrinogen-III synthase